VSTLGQLKNKTSGRGAMDLSELRVVVMDEVDFFFRDNNNKKELEMMNKNVFQKLKQKFQWILFSATYPEEVVEEINKITKEASIIMMKKEKLQLDHIKQFVI
jgi:superfamily II DNA/RNA helicase